MSALEKIYALIDAISHHLGRAVSWIAVAMVLLQFAIVLMRYIFGQTSILMQESVVYLHSMLFLMGASYTLLHEGHVRVDIFYRDARERTKALIDFLGAIFFLIPVCVLLWWWSWPYVEQSWAVQEGSKETSGIQVLYLLKSTILVFAGLMGLQGVSMALRTLLILTGHSERHAREDGAQV